jgi:hypothetical protein
LSVEHLTPAPWVKPLCDVASVDLGAVAAIERAFRASRVMAAMRFVELSSHCCACAYVERGLVKWMKPSRTFPRYITKGTAAPSGSIAAEYFATGTVHRDPRTYSASLWLGTGRHAHPETMIIEHAALIPEPGWGGVLSLLWIPQLVRASN